MPVGSAVRWVSCANVNLARKGAQGQGRGVVRDVWCAALFLRWMVHTSTGMEKQKGVTFCKREEQGEIYAEIMVDLSYIGFLFICQLAVKNWSWPVWCEPWCGCGYVPWSPWHFKMKKQNCDKKRNKTKTSTFKSITHLITKALTSLCYYRPFTLTDWLQ